ncbi:MAG: MerR family transcriptional regulator [Lachnospira sp.]|nr:MerR family transcriptional regulator [Lachnospira sp.]
MKYKISELAKLLDVSTNTVRRYEDMGYIHSVRDDNSGYRYYGDDALFGIMNARIMRKYEFTHEELDDLLQYNLNDSIAAYEKKMAEIDERIAYMSDVRHRIKDDLVLMRKAAAGGDVYEKRCMDYTYIVFKHEDKLSHEAGRLKKVQEFLYDCPEIQRIYIIRKDALEKGKMRLVPGIAVKCMDMAKYNVTENEYTEYYPQQKSIMCMVRMPGDRYDSSEEELKELILGKHLDYMQEHNMHIAGDIIAIIISRVIEEGQEVMYLLVSVPVE